MELPSWNWAIRKGQPLEVSVYSRAELVRLELNGRVIGEQAIDPSKSITARFTVSWEPGALVAKALDKGAIVAVRELRTTGPASSLRCTPESTRVRAARESLLFIPIEVTDAKGALVPDAAVEFTIAVEGEATLQALGSANPTDLGSVMDSKATSFRGRALAILRSTGKAGSARIRLSASGFQPITATVEFVP
jgi:beta-galactosidase